MPVNYFSDSTSYPSIINPILERLRYYVCKELFYTTEEYSTSKTQRFILADISNNAFRVASKITKATNFSMPITVYAIGELETDMNKLAPNAFIKMTYNHTYSAIFNSMASVLTIPMITIFNTASDYYRAWTILQQSDLKKTLLQVPIVINGISTTIPMLVDNDPPPVKGLYAFELEQQLGVGRINTIQHDFKLYFHNLIIDTDIKPVDDIELFLNSYTGDDYRDCIRISSGLVPATPSVSSTIPATGATSYPVSSGIIINFNVAMEEDITNSYIDIDPYVWYEANWNSLGSQVIITPNANLTSGTAYTVTVYEEVESGDGVNMSEDYEFEFTTV